tara:strand:+ start:193 stop:420 length:228 start_codon:yes stop_codon:yes gene_type:complete
MEGYYKVDGHSDLARDPESGAIINVNSMEHDQYVHRRNVKKLKNEDLHTMKDDLDSLKGEMTEIKSLLRELVNGK